MSEQLLDNADIVIGLEKMGGEGMAEGVGGDALGDPCASDGMVESLL